MYKPHFTFFISILLFCQGAAYGQFIYVYPIPNSRFHMPDRIIILRANENIDSLSLQPSLFTITGSESGLHAFTMHLADDKRTINLIPNSFFTYAESVTVQVHSGIKTIKGAILDTLNFTFSIRNAPGMINQADRKNRELDDDDASISDRNSGEVIAPNTGGVNILVNTNPDEGNVFFCNGNIIHVQNAQFVDIIKSNGDSVFKLNYHQYGTDFKINQNDYITIFDPDSLRYDMWDSSYHVIRSFKPYDGYTADEHEFMFYPDGHYDMLAKDTLTLDMQVYDSTYQPLANVVGAVVQKMDAHNNLMMEWRSWDSISLLESQHTLLSTKEVDYVHANSIEEDSDGNILLSCRHLDQVIKINVETGAMIWRWGGVKNQFIFVNDTAKFTSQHDVRRLPNGHYTMFDNGNFHTPAQSFAKEYTLDQQHKIATLVWFYAHPYLAGKALVGTAMGSVQRLPHNHTLIDWGLLKNTIFPNMSEIDSLGNIVWEMKFVDSTNVAYRAHRYSWNPCSRPTSYTLSSDSVRTTSACLEWTNGTNAEQYNLQVKTLSDTNWNSYYVKVPDTLIKLNNLKPENIYEWRVASICDTLNIISSSSGYTDTKVFSTIATGVMPSQQSLLLVYPNPAFATITIVLPEKPSHTVHCELLSETGAIVLETEFFNNKTSIQLPNIPSGIYLLKLSNQEISATQKISVVK